MGRKDLAITPDARMGFEMALLRMLAFRPGAERREPPAAVAKAPEARDEPDPAPAAQSPAAEAQNHSPDSEPAPQAEAPPSPAPEPVPAEVQVSPEPELQPDAPANASPDPAEAAPAEVAASPFEDQDAYLDSLSDYQDGDDAEAAAAERLAADLMGEGNDVAVAPAAPEPEQREPNEPPAESPAAIAQPEAEEAAPTPAAPQPAPEEFSWPRDFRSLGVVGMPGNLASNAAFSRDGDKVTLTLAQGHARLLTERHQDKIREALSAYFGIDVKLQVVEGDPGEHTPAIWEENVRKARQAAAEDAIRNDPLVQSIVERFEGRVVEGSIRPLEKS